MNKVILVGRLTRDPEVRSTTSGVTIVSFSLAVNRNFKNKDGNYDADFFNCVAYRNQAEFISKYFKKGSLVGIDGRLQSRSYDAQDGTKRYVTEVVVENSQFVGSKSDSSSYQPNNTDNNDYSSSNSDFGVENAPKEYDISTSDPYENYDKEISLSDNDLPF